MICRSAESQSQHTSDGRLVSRFGFETSLVAQTRSENLCATPIQRRGRVSGRSIAGPWRRGQGQGRTAGMGPRDGARVWPQWKDGARGRLRRERVIGSGATNSLSFGLTQNVWCFHYINQFGPHRESCVSITKTSSDLH